MALGAFLFLGFVIGTATGAALGPLIRYIRDLGATRVYVLNPLNNNITRKLTKLSRTGGFLKINGQKARPPLKERYRWKEGDSPAILINARTGKPLALNDDGDFSWPTPYECAEVYNDIREQKIQESATDRSADYAKLGAVIGIVITALLIGGLVMLWKLLQQGGVAPV